MSFIIYGNRRRGWVTQQDNITVTELIQRVTADAGLSQNFILIQYKIKYRRRRLCFTITAAFGPAHYSQNKKRSPSRAVWDRSAPPIYTHTQ